MSAFQKDYILRLIETIAAILARIAVLRENGESEEAKAELERAYGLLLGSQDDIVRRVDPATAAVLLGSSEKIHVLALLVDEEAEQEEDEGRRDLLRARAAGLRAQAAPGEPS
ncbi:MAG: hypothetical protein WC971_08835 [Coriobacteriia bacterium]